MKFLKTFFLVLGMLWLSTVTVPASTLVFDLVCVLNGLNSTPCVPISSFGSITLTDLTGGNAGKVQVDVDLLNTSLKFRDLMLNYAGSATSITSSDGQVSLSSNFFKINPYLGKFDVGSTTTKGWDGGATANNYSTILSGNSALSVADFFDLDSLGNIGAAIHIQSLAPNLCTGGTNSTNCTPGGFSTDDGGSLKIGGDAGFGVFEIVPEPSTYALMGTGILVLGLLRRRKR